MNRWWIIAATLLLFVAGDRLGAGLAERLLLQSPQRYARLYSGRLRADVLCVGNSRGVFLLDQAEIKSATGQTVANISYNGLTVQLARALFQDYLEHNEKPKILVLEGSFVTVKTERGIVAEFKPFWNVSPRLRELGDRYCPTVVDATRITRLHQFDSEMFLRSLYFSARRRTDQDAVMNGQVPAALLEEVDRLEPFKMEIEPAELEALRGLVDDARKAGVVVRLVYAPYLPRFAQKMTNLDEFLKAIEQSGGTEVIDLTRAINDEHVFADRVHLNGPGTKALTKMLITRGVFNQ